MRRTVQVFKLVRRLEITGYDSIATCPRHSQVSLSHMKGVPSNFSRSARSTSQDGHSLEPPPSLQQLRRHWVNAAIPMVGFGAMDNFIMIQAGDLIDSTLGVKFGLATLTAAACGQICSDFSGVCFGGLVEALASKLGLAQSGLSDTQLQLRVVKTVGTCGAAIGVVFGCCIGMSCLFFMDLEKAERLKKQTELRTLFDTIMGNGHKTMNVQHCTLWLVEHGGDDKQIYVATRARIGDGATEDELRRAFKLWDTHADGRLRLADLQRGLQKMGRIRTELQVQALIDAYSQQVPDSLLFDEFKDMMLETVLREEVVLPLRPQGVKGQVYSSKKLLNIDRTFNKSASRGAGYYSYSGTPDAQSMLMSPIIDAGGSVIGFVEMVNKLSSDGRVVAFTEQDEKIIEMLSVHAAIFIETTLG